MLTEAILESLAEIFFNPIYHLDKIGGWWRYVLYNSFYYITKNEKRRDLKSFYKPKSGKKTEVYDIHFTNSLIGLVFLLILFYILAIII